jgi:hypothetical protein
VDVTICPVGVPPAGLSTATQSETLGQDMSARLLPGSSFASVQASDPPVGSVEVTTLPRVSPATHSEDEGQATVRMSVGLTYGAA